jgi:hypothetical protein
MYVGKVTLFAQQSREKYYSFLRDIIRVFFNLSTVFPDRFAKVLLIKPETVDGSKGLRLQGRDKPEFAQSLIRIFLNSAFVLNVFAIWQRRKIGYNHRLDL